MCVYIKLLVKRNRNAGKWKRAILAPIAGRFVAAVDAMTADCIPDIAGMEFRDVAAADESDFQCHGSEIPQARGGCRCRR